MLKEKKKKRILFPMVVTICLFVLILAANYKQMKTRAASIDPRNAVGFLCGKRASEESVCITEDPYADYLDVYLPGKIDEGVRLVCDWPFSVKIDGKTYRNHDLLPMIAAGEPMEAELINRFGATVAGSFRFYEADGLPCVFMLTLDEDGEEQIEAEKGNKTSAEIVTATADGSIDQVGMGGIKVHGNTSWFEDKKSYNINLQRETSLLGMGAQRKWVLVQRKLNN